MANEFRKVTDQNGVDHPVCDDTRVDWASYAKTGVHNFLPLQISAIKANNTEGTWDNNVYTRNSVTFTFTVDTNGNVTEVDVDGTASAAMSVTLYPNSSNIFNGLKLLGCPSGGSSNTYRLQLWDQTGNTGNDDFGNGVIINKPNGNTVRVVIYIEASAEMSHIKYYPMIKLPNDTDTSMTLYAMTNRELTDAILNGESYGNVIAISASGQTWAAQLTEIKTAWDNLTLNQKRNAKIIVSGDIYICSNTDTGNFSSVAYAVDGSTPVINAKTLRLSSQTACKMLLKSTGNTVNDDSSSTNNDRMQLVSGI